MRFCVFSGCRDGRVFLLRFYVVVVVCVCFFSNPYSIITNYKNTFLCWFLLLYILSPGCFSQNVLDIEY